MAIQLQIPNWLNPPSQEDRDRMQLAEDQAKQHAATMLRKQVGLSRMQQEAKQLTDSGVPELDARKTALINNAEYIFADNPQAVANIIHSDQADAIRARAEARLQQRVDDLHEYQMRMADAKEARDNAPVTPTIQEFEGKKFLVNPKTGVSHPLDGSDTTPTVQEFEGKKFLVSPKSGAIHPLSGGNLSGADKAKLADLYSQMREKRKDLEKETDDTAKLQRTYELSQLQKQVRILTGEQPATKPAPTAGAAAPATVAPVAPADKVRVKKDGKSYFLPKSQLDEAIKQGYTPE